MNTHRIGDVTVLGDPAEFPDLASCPSTMCGGCGSPTRTATTPEVSGRCWKPHRKPGS